LTLRNTARRPITFRVAGTTVRLSPGERLEVPKAWLGSAELRRFCGAGLVSTQAATQKPADTEDGGEVAEGKRTGKSPISESKQPTPAKPKTRNPGD
jgi:hypothetical protein